MFCKTQGIQSFVIWINAMNYPVDLENTIVLSDPMSDLGGSVRGYTYVEDLAILKYVMKRCDG